MKYRSYSELRQYSDFMDRFEYLNLKGQVGEATFGFDRYLNQRFYRSTEWLRIRDFVITRDNGCDLGVPGYDIHSRIYIHHMNPMRIEDFKTGNPDILNPEYLICVTHQTHNAIHFGNANNLQKPVIERTPGDTTPWR